VKCETPKSRNRHIKPHDLISISEFQIPGVGGVKSRDSSSQESEVVKCRNPETGTSTKTPFRSFGDRDMEFRSFGDRDMECQDISPQECRNVGMRNAKNTFWCRFRIPGVGVSKHFTTGIPKCQNVEMRKTPFGAGFGYRELEVSKHFTTGMPKCRNAEMRKTPFGASFGYRELEVSKHFTTGMPKCRNVGMPKCEIAKALYG
jgi:hypothetical protein